jgi:hypothetical protein
MAAPNRGKEAIVYFFKIRKWQIGGIIISMTDSLPQIKFTELPIEIKLGT